MNLLIPWFVPILVLFPTVAVLSYFYMTRYFDYWKKLGVPYIKPSPFLGNFGEIITFKISIAEGFQKLYNKIDAPYVGIFVFDRPVLMLKSPKLIYDVLIKGSSSFINRTTASPEHNKINSNYLIFKRGIKWKQTRTKLNPVFSPIKLKRMFGLVEEITRNLCNKCSKKSIVNLRDLISGYTPDISARCFIGISTDCMDNKDSVFLKTCKSMFSFTWRNVLIQSGYFFKPELINFFHLDLLKPSIVEYFSNILLDMLDNRTQPVGKSQDLIDILKEMQEQMVKGGKMTQEEKEEILAGAITFIFGGTETIGSSLSFALYELAIREDIQERARTEAREVVNKYDGVTYEAVLNAKFLDMCISETIRKYPIAPHLCREASTTYTFEGTDLTIEKGTRVYIPLFPMQMDEKYFPNPTEFNPDRFQNSKKREGELNFIPFGAGPRICIGERFGLMVMKTAMIHLLLNFKLERCPTTPKNIEFEIKSFIVKSKTGLDVKITPLEKC